MGGENVWPPAGPEPIQPAGELNRKGIANVFFHPGQGVDHVYSLGRAKNTAGRGNSWPPAGLELIQPAGKIKQTKLQVFFPPGR